MLGSVEQNKFIRNQMWVIYIHLQRITQVPADFVFFAQRNRIATCMVNKLILLNKSLVQYSSLNGSYWLYLIGIFMNCFLYHLMHTLNTVFGCSTLYYPFIAEN